MKKVIIFQASKKMEHDLANLLTRRGYNLHFEANLANAQQIVTQQDPMVCLFDVDTHVADVNSVLSTLKRSVASAVFVSGKKENINKLDLLVLNSVFAFLEKPIDETALFSALFDLENVFGQTYRDLIENQSLFGFCIVQDDKFKFINKKFVKTSGYTHAELLKGTVVSNLVAPIDRGYVTNQYRRLFDQDVKDINICFTVITKQQEEIEVEVWGTKILYEGRPAVQAIISDISERKTFQLKEKMYEFRMMHEQKLASIGQLATGIAHNLNTPISVILSNAELLQMKYNDSPELDKIIRQADRMSQIINGLLTKSKQEQLQNPQEIDLNELIENELEFMNSNLEFKHNIGKEYKFAPSIPPIIAVYSDLSQSIMNILQNAIDAMYKRPVKKLTLQTRYDDKFIYLMIKDTGCGIDAKDLNRLFDPFYSTKPSPLDRVGDEPTGTGLGLSTVYNLLTPYGIEIKINSQLDVGTEITLKIPLKIPNFKKSDK